MHLYIMMMMMMTMTMTMTSLFQILFYNYHNSLRVLIILLILCYSCNCCDCIFLMLLSLCVNETVCWLLSMDVECCCYCYGVVWSVFHQYCMAWFCGSHDGTRANLKKKWRPVATYRSIHIHTAMPLYKTIEPNSDDLQSVKQSKIFPRPRPRI